MTSATGERPTALFGTPTRTALLTILAAIDESHLRELARLTSVSLSSVQSAILALEREGVVATRRTGSERRVALNPRYDAYKELKELLFKMLDLRPELRAVIRAQRRGPRRIVTP